MRESGSSMADRIIVAISIVGALVLAVVSSREMGREEGRKEVSRDLFEQVPKWAASCRLYPDGSKVCRPAAVLMERSRREWAWQESTQKRLAGVE